MEPGARVLIRSHGAINPDLMSRHPAWRLLQYRSEVHRLRTDNPSASGLSGNFRWHYQRGTFS